jgi:hypothetical protein
MVTPSHVTAHNTAPQQKVRFTTPNHTLQRCISSSPHTANTLILTSESRVTRTPFLPSFHLSHNATPTPLGLTALGTLILLAAGPDDERYTIPVPVRGLGFSTTLPAITSVCVTVTGDDGCDFDCDWVRLSWSCRFLLYISTPPGRGGCSPGCRSFSARGRGLGGPLLFFELTNGTEDTCSCPLPFPWPFCAARLDRDGLGVDSEV